MDMMMHVFVGGGEAGVEKYVCSPFISVEAKGLSLSSCASKNSTGEAASLDSSSERLQMEQWECMWTKGLKFTLCYDLIFSFLFVSLPTPLSSSLCSCFLLG